MDLYKISETGSRVKLTQEELNDLYDFTPETTEPQSELDEMKKQLSDISEVISRLKNSRLLSSIFSKAEES